MISIAQKDFLGGKNGFLKEKKRIVLSSFKKLFTTPKHMKKDGGEKIVSIKEVV